MALKVGEVSSVRRKAAPDCSIRTAQGVERATVRLRHVTAPRDGRGGGVRNPPVLGHPCVGGMASVWV